MPYASPPTVLHSLDTLREHLIGHDISNEKSACRKQRAGILEQHRAPNVILGIIGRLGEGGMQREEQCVSVTTAGVKWDSE